MRRKCFGTSSLRPAAEGAHLELTAWNPTPHSNEPRG
jgi:hypothetical protein